MEPMTREEMAELIGGIEDAPVPANMARRAVDRWALESARTSILDRLAAWMAGPAVRPAIALAAAAVLVVVVRGRLGQEPQVRGDRAATPGLGTLQNRTHGTDRTHASYGTDRTDGTQGGVQGRAQRKSHAPMSDEAEPRTSAKGIQRTRAALEAPAPVTGLAEKKAPPEPDSSHPKLAMRADMESLAASGPDSAIDLAYLNGADAFEGGEEAEGKWSDTRLLVRITLAEDDTALPDLIGRIGASAGLAVAFSDALAETQVAVHCVDRPVGEVLRQLARAFDLRWERSRTGSAARYAAVPARRLVADAGADMARAGAAPGGIGGLAGASPSRSIGGSAGASPSRSIGGSAGASPSRSIGGSAGAAPGGIGGSAGASPSQGGPMRAAGRAAPTERGKGEANEKTERPRTNWIGNPARVRAMRADGSMPADALVEGWIIAR